jgi:thiamine biosynthesis protein ThiI
LVTFLIRYNELGLKSPRVRARFQNQMIKNIEDKFLNAGLDCFISSDWGRIFLDTEEKDKGISILQTVFGLTSVSPVKNSTAELDDITNTTISLTQDLIQSNQSFALRTRRTGQHRYTSMELAQQLGTAILKRFPEKNLKVNLTRPDVEIFVEVRQNKSYIFSESYPGPGGLPLGTQGKVISIFNTPNSYIASWLLMKRGCRVFPVFFNGTENAIEISKETANQQLDYLKPWVMNVKLKVIEQANNNGLDKIESYLNNDELIRFCQFTNAKGICFSYRLMDFSMQPFNNGSGLPIFFPLIGLDEEFIKNVERQIRRMNYQ